MVTGGSLDVLGFVVEFVVVLVGSGGDDGGDEGGERDGEDEAGTADEVADDLGGDLVAGEQVVDGAAGDTEQQQEWEGGAGVREYQGVDGAGDVVPADAHASGEQPVPGCVGVGFGQFPDGGGLGDGDVVEHAEGTDDEPAQDEPGDRDVDAGGLQLVVDLVRSAGQLH